MTSRKSSGSSRAASAVESTRSQNITVSCRRLGHSGRRSIGSAGSLGPERGDGIKQSPAMSDQIDVEILQIVGGQAGQQARVDLIRAERRLVLLEPETAEPCRNVHACLQTRSPPRRFTLPPIVAKGEGSTQLVTDRGDPVLADARNVSSGSNPSAQLGTMKRPLSPLLARCCALR